MKNIEQIAIRINRDVKKWAQQHKKLVIVIDGYTGSGKTSVANKIAELNPNCLVIHLDDFIKHWKNRKQMMNNAQDRAKVFEYSWYRYDTIKRLVKAFLIGKRRIRLKVYDFDKNEFIVRIFDMSDNILIIEGIFLIRPRRKRNTIRIKRVFLKTNPKKAEARHFAQEKKRWGSAYLPEDHPDSYFRDFKVAYKRYLDRCNPEQRADLVINVDD